MLFVSVKLHGSATAVLVKILFQVTKFVVPCTKVVDPGRLFLTMNVPGAEGWAVNVKASCGAELNANAPGASAPGRTWPVMSKGRTDS